MSVYHIQWIAYQKIQQQVIAGLAAAGLFLVLGWLLLDKMIPAKWVPVGKWIYLLSCFLLGLVMILSVKG